ncbi:MAG: hypothetical protein GWO24_38375, partial [Akkermansiaceae bacterium]|nr:hypothetical protein [Akkermansiaceae bacterium]
MAKIGGRRANATDTTTHSGGQDEVAIWLDRVLTEEEVLSLWQAAITTTPQRVNKRVTTAGDELVITWESKGGKLYNLRSAPDLSNGDPF